MGRAKAARPTRRQKVSRYEEVAPVVFQSDIPVRPKTVEKFEPKNQRQKEALGHLVTGKPVVFLTGSAGVGKSMIAAYYAATLLTAKKINKIYLVRPAVTVGKSIGALPGTTKEKLAPYFAQTVSHLSKFLGPGYTNYCLEKDVIEMQPVEYLRGRSFEDCFVLIEESQNLTHEEFEMLLTRLGEDCQMVFTGDQKQNDLRLESGLKTTVELIEKTLQSHPNYMLRDDMDALDDCIGIVKFTPDDVVRSGLTRALVKLYFHTS